MNRHSLFIVLISLGSMLGANAAPGLKEIKDEKTELKKLEGDWKIESWVQLGCPVTVTGTWTIKEKKYTSDKETNVEGGTIKMDRTKKPAVFDLAITAGTCKGQDQLGIYKLDGDTLTLS